MKRLGSIASILLAAIPATAHASTVDIDFHFDGLEKYFDHSASTGLWNADFGQIQPAVSPGGIAGKEIDFGDGSDGIFSDGPAQTGITLDNPNAPTEIVFNTDVKSTYNFEVFSVSAGVTLRVTGTRPLTIRVLGGPSIGGDIVVDGADGDPNDLAGSAKAGGAALAGGAAGGKSGAWGTGGTGTTGAAGSATAPAVGGGFGSNATATTADQGGGGGCNGADGTDDALAGLSNSVSLANQASCASTQASIASGFESVFTGGAGGGGGGALIDTVSPDTNSIVGSGGGAGGGAIHIATLSFFDFAGNIFARGGDGGNYDTINAASADCGGGGGGGSGGSVWLQSGDTLFDGGNIVVSGGAGGASTAPACAGKYDGGAGSRGVIRADTSDGSPVLNAGVTPDVTNTVTFPANQTYVVVSKPIDFSDRYYSFSPPTKNWVGCKNSGAAIDADASNALTFEGSNDGVHFEHEVSEENIAELNNYAYLRFKATINTGSATNPPCLTALSIPYEESDLREFKLKGGLFCGRIRFDGDGSDGNGPGPMGILGDTSLLLAALLLSRRRLLASVLAGR